MFEFERSFFLDFFFFESCVDLWLEVFFFVDGLCLVVIFVIRMVMFDEIWDFILGLMIMDFMWIGNGSWNSNSVGGLIKWVVKKFCEFFLKFVFIRLLMEYLFEFIML